MVLPHTLLLELHVVLDQQTLDLSYTAVADEKGDPATGLLERSHCDCSSPVRALEVFHLAEASILVRKQGRNLALESTQFIQHRLRIMTVQRIQDPLVELGGHVTPDLIQHELEVVLQVVRVLLRALASK